MEALVKQAQLQANLLSLTQFLVSDSSLHSDEPVKVEFTRTTFRNNGGEEYKDNYEVLLCTDGDILVKYTRYRVENENLTELIDDYSFNAVSVKYAIEFILA